MEKQQIIEKVKTLMQDEMFKQKLAEANSFDEMATAFQNEGFQVTGAELEEAYESQQKGEEISEKDLENVAGGFTFTGIIIAGVIVFAGGSILLGYIDGVKKKAKECKIFG